MVVFSGGSESLVRFASWDSCIEVEIGRSKIEGVVSWLSDRISEYHSNGEARYPLNKGGSLPEYLQYIG